jgi:anhydro-N-acetylmuramic acid kinase
VIAVGLMSGTSLDGIDAALVRIRPKGSRYRVDLLNFVTRPFSAGIEKRLRALLPPASGSVEETARLHHDLGSDLGRAAIEVRGDMPLDFIGSHGLSAWHDGDAHVTLQIGDAFAIREIAATTVCYDFRSADCAAGGQGAPLVPYVDALLLGSDDEDRVAVNVGGIANLTWIPRRSSPQDVTAFDSGPGNMLIDAFIRGRSGGAEMFDRDGMHARRGTIRGEVLDTLLAEPYFALAAPKSTGRERFGSQFLQAHASLIEPLSTEDGAATLAALTAVSIAAAVRTVAVPGARVLVSGGGARNPAIMALLAERLPGFVVEDSGKMGLHPDAKEAMAFALLGYEALRGREASLPRVTGAAHPALLGAVAPFDLRSLLAKMDAECRA